MLNFKIKLIYSETHFNPVNDSYLCEALVMRFQKGLFLALRLLVWDMILSYLITGMVPYSIFQLIWVC